MASKKVLKTWFINYSVRWSLHSLSTSPFLEESSLFILSIFQLDSHRFRPFDICSSRILPPALIISAGILSELELFLELSLFIVAWISDFGKWLLIVLGFCFGEIFLRLINSAFTMILVFLNNFWQYSVHPFVIYSDICSVFPWISLIVLSFNVHFLFKSLMNWYVSLDFFRVHSPKSSGIYVAVTWSCHSVQICQHNSRDFQIFQRFWNLKVVQFLDRHGDRLVYLM